MDRDRGRGLYILTGSRHFPLMEGVSESLAGRAAVLSLFPLVGREIRRDPLPGPAAFDGWLDEASKRGVPARPPRLGTRLLRGGYPALHARRETDLPLFFSSYVQTYLDRDVRGDIRNENLRDFESFLRLTAARTGQILNYSSLAGEVGVTVPTVKSWLSILEAASILFRLPPFHKNFGKRIIRSPNLYFWRSTDGHEVDLLVETGGRLTPIEIKRTATVKPAHAKGLDKWREISGESPSSKAWLVTSSAIGPALWRFIGHVHWAAL